MKMQTSVRVEDRFYNESKKVFDAFGMSFGDAVNLFLAKVALEKRIPFVISLPSDEMMNRIDRLETGSETKVFATSTELFKELGI
ncbi:MAG: type II toxin-antitoxin system RelB/DinJ family antitoxin [Sulfuricurvum sp.]